MEELLKKLCTYRRQLELEDHIISWEYQTTELKARISEMTENLRKKEEDLKALENPGFFLRLAGKTESRKEKIRIQLKEITAARMAAQWEQESLDKKIRAGKQELETLSHSQADYVAAKADTVLSAAQESRLMMEEISALAPAAMTTAGKLLEALEAAGLWVQKGKQDGQLLGHAEAIANKLCDILSALPEGTAPVGSFLLAPCDYLYGGDTTDRLHQAQEQIQRVINQLRLLLGE